MSGTFGVFPAPERRGYRAVGRMEDVYGMPILLSVNRDGNVRIEFKDMPARPLHVMFTELDQDECEEFARLFVAACWEAARLSTEVM